MVLGLSVPVLVLLAIDRTDWVDRFVRPLQRPDTAGTAEVIVVLGAGYFEPCGLNLSALRRTFAAVRLWRDGRGPMILFSGGRTATSGDEPVARHMARLARQIGVPAEAILEETHSRTTWENARYSAEMLSERGVRRILLVTDSIHMGRASACFDRFDFEIERASVPQVCVSASNAALLRAAIHEYVGWAYYVGKGYASRP